ncbi:major facilitator superfamily domain-containing protein [Phialemonium atrogriseum]|uniref:Major facilitator superfamily domain-containing protein n=1 Tax=Phialemonium atrogriseum TaxID=1093897 RepID=A0AAJ0FE74_9PEZI|nr:major facilitator superfamily domain-containing protein [Phialemonium atrogriseum]KAK1765296.1 major facilitator superfamily domain-containing protein [Phialemonium atrogriseum]
MATMAEKSGDDVFQADSTGSSHTGTGAVDEANIEIDAEWTTAEETAIRRKFDLTIVPMVTILYMCCAIDRANIGNAKIEGMASDLNLIKYRYNIVLSIFFITYLSVEVPSNVILKRFGPRFYMPMLVFCFGLISLCTAFVQSYASLAVTRAFLGIFEGGAMPATAFFLSCFYKKAELFFRMSIFIASSALASSFGGLLAAALSSIPPWGTAATTIDTWRNIFFFEGLVTMLIAIGATFFMPQSPGSWKYLTPRQRYIAGERMRREHDANPKEAVTWHHVRQAIFNIHTNVCAWCFFCTNSAVQGMGAFVPTILKEFGWTSTKAQLYSVPPYVVACCVTVALGHASDRVNKRGIFMLGSVVFSITGYFMLRFSEDVHTKYAAVFLSAIGIFAASSGFLSWGINNTNNPAVAAVAGGYMVSIGSIGGVLSTWTYLSTDSPKFHIGHSINLSLQLFCFFLAAFGLAHCKYENKIRAQGKRDHRLHNLSEEELRKLGHKHPQFRYME